MGTIKKVNGKWFIISEFSSLKPDTDIRKYYQWTYYHWLFRYSDEVFINNELLTKKHDKDILYKQDAYIKYYQFENFNIDLVNKEVKTSNTIKGFPLTELQFIEKEIKTYKPIYEDIKGDLINIALYSKLKIYIDFLESKYEKRKLNKPNYQISELEPEAENNNKLSMKAYVLMHYYLSESKEGEAVTNKNKNDIASKYGFKGHKFYQLFNELLIPSNRRNLEESKRKDESKLKIFNDVISLLKEHPNALKIANDEYNLFINQYNKEYK